MRFRVVSVCCLSLVLGLTAPAAAAEDRWSLDASIGPSFGSLGTTFVVRGAATFPLHERFALVGEAGVVPRASFEEADEIALPLPGVTPSSDFRVNGYHANLNALVRFPEAARHGAYLTGGLGSFLTESVATGRLDEVRFGERRRRTDFATNVGAGLTFRLTDWVGVNGDYRTFFVHRDGDTPRVHRLTTGLTFFLK